MSKEIVIKMSNVNEPPEVKINGEKLNNIATIEYRYETSNADNNGKHSYSISYFDEESNSIRVVMASKMT